MSVQIFLEGKLLGIDEFLLAPAGENPDQVFLGRSHWISLLSEVLPRALLAELGLAKILLGSSGGGQFLLVLAGRIRAMRAEAFLEAAAAEIAALSDGVAEAALEHHGKPGRLERRPPATARGDGPASRRARGSEGSALFEAPPAIRSRRRRIFHRHSAAKLRDAETAGWSPETSRAGSSVEGGKARRGA